MPQVSSPRSSARRLPGAVLHALLLALLVPLLALGTGGSPARATTTTLTTLFTTMSGPRTVQGLNSVAVGPTELGSYRAAMAFTPTVSGDAQLLTMHGRCVPNVGASTACANTGQVTIESNAGGRPSGTVLGRMGFYLLQDAEGATRIKINGHPTGGSFKLRIGDATTGPLPYNMSHEDVATNIRVRLGTFATAITAGTFPDQIGFFNIGPPITATDVSLTGGASPSITISSSHLDERCGTISPSPHLTAGTKYWAVMTSDEEVAWEDWTDAIAEVLESIDGSPWVTAFNPKTLGLRIDAGADTCLPVAQPNPASGTAIGEMYVHTGSKAFDTVTISNTGVAPLTLGGASFTGDDSGVFSVMNGEPGPLARPFPFPRVVGVGPTEILYVTCTGATTERWYRSSLMLQTSDPALPNVIYPLECLVDNTPPTIGFSQSANGLAGWWTSATATLAVHAVDPESGNRVKQVSCGNSHGSMSPSGVFGAAMSASISGEGVHAISCSAVDVANNGSAGFPTEVKIDSRPPVAAAAFTPPLTADGWNNAATSLTFACNDPVPGSGVATPTTDGGTITTETAGTSFTSGGCTDVAGHVSVPVTATIRIDMTNPAITSAGVTPAPNAAGWNNSDATVAFDCADTGAIRSGIKTDTVSDVVVSAETSTTVVNSSGSCIDKAANDAPSQASQQVKLDKTDPSTVVDSGPGAVTRETTTELAFSGDDALSGLTGLECREAAAAFAACTSPVMLTGLADGEHSFAVRGRDAAGNVDPTPASRTWRVDTLPPETSVESGPAEATAATSASFVYSGDELGGSAVGNFECRLDDAAFGSCPGSGMTYSALADGEHAFAVRAIDAAGNVDGTPATRTWTVDTVTPETSIDTSPASPTEAASAAFAYSGQALGGSPIVGFECRLDGGAFASCPGSAITYTALADGEHAFAVRAIDAAGNVDGTPAARSWTVDSIAPETNIDSGPVALTAATTAAFAYSGDALGGSALAGFECRLDGGAFEACPNTGMSYSGLAGGEHSFAVRALDAAGNADGTPATHTWTVDTIAPETSVDSGPAALTAATTAAFAYSGDALGGSALAGFECRLDGGAFAACPTSGASYSGLAGGEHRFAVRAVDNAGNADATPAEFVWSIDLLGPTTTIGSGPADPTAESAATFVFTAVDAGGSSVAGSDCRLDAAPFTPCASLVSYAGLTLGRHTFQVRASDLLGNVESPPASFSWTIAAFGAADDLASTREDASATIDVGENDLRPGGLAVTVAPTRATSAKGGSVTSVSDESIRYVPPPDFNGTDAFAYTASLGAVTTAPATVTVTVAAVNDAPAFVAGAPVAVQEDSGAHDAPWASAAGAGPPNESEQRVSFAIDTSSKPGLFSAGPTVSPAGALSFTPAANASGTAKLEVRLVDDGGTERGGRDTSASASLTIEITPVNDAPTIAVARGIDCGATIGTLHLLVQDVDNESSALIVSGSSSPAHVRLAFDGAGSDRTLTITGGRRASRAALIVRASDGGLSSAAPITLVVGSNRRDAITGGDGPDVLFGLGGRDVLEGRGGNDIICGGEGADAIDGGAGDDVLRGGLGNDMIRGAEGNDVLRGGGGEDRLFGGPGDDLLRGGLGADVFAPAPGTDAILDFRASQGDRLVPQRARG